MGVPELMGCESAAHASPGCGLVPLGADTRARPRTPDGRTAQQAEQGADRKGGAQFQPWAQLLPGPSVHPDLAALAAFAVAHQDRAAVQIQVAFVQGQCFADAQPGAPQHHDETA